MDYFRWRKILVFLLGFLAACSGKQMRVASAGYNYHEDLSNLNRILKAVLVHESTGNGIYPGSISNPGSNGGEIIKVSKQAGYSGGHMTSGYTYSTSQQMKSNLGLSQSPPIRVFHESAGNKGHIQPQASTMPQVSLVKIVKDYRPTNELRNIAGLTSKTNPARTLQYIHEAALSRSRSDQQFSSDSSVRSQSPFAPKVFTIQTLNGGYQYENSGKSRNVGDQQQGGRGGGGYQSENRGIYINNGPGPGGYQYPAPVQPLRQGFEVGNHQTVNSASVQNLNQGFGVENLQTVNSGSVQNLNQGYGVKNLQTVNSGPVQNLNQDFGVKNLQTVNSGSVQTLNQGYGVENFQTVNSVSVQNSNQGFDVQNFGSGSARAVKSGPAQNSNQAFRAENVGSGSSQPVNFSPNSALSEGSINSNLKSESINTPSNGYQYPALLQILGAGFVNEDQKNAGNNPVQATHLNSIQVNKENLRNTQIGSLKPASVGYQYSSSGQTKSEAHTSTSENLRSFLSNESLQPEYSARGPKDQGYQYDSLRNMGYSYRSPDVTQGGAEQIAISQYVSSTQPNSQNQGYRYENAGLTQNSLPQGGYQYADQSTRGGHHNESPRTGGYQYSNPEARQVGFEGGQNHNSGPNVNTAFNQLQQPGESSYIGYSYVAPTRNVDGSYRPVQTKDIGLQNEGFGNRPDSAKSVFKGQPYLPLPSAAKDSASGYESPRPAQDDGFRYEKPELNSRPETTFKGQSYLPLPPTASGSQFENPRIPQSDGYRYDKPDLSSRPETTFKGQSYLPLPPVSGSR